MAFSNKIIPTPGVEPGPPGWKPDILAVRPRGIMFLSGIEPETFCVLGRRDNRYTIETCYILLLYYYLLLVLIFSRDL